MILRLVQQRPIPVALENSKSPKNSKLHGDNQLWLIFFFK